MGFNLLFCNDRYQISLDTKCPVLDPLKCKHENDYRLIMQPNSEAQSYLIFNERKLVLETVSVVKVKVTTKKFRNSLILPDLLDDLCYC